MTNILKELEGKEHETNYSNINCYFEHDIIKAHNKIVDKMKERITRQVKVIDGLMKDISHLKESNEIGLDVQRDKDREIAELQKSIKHMTDDTYIRMSDEMMEDFKAFKQRKVK